MYPETKHKSYLLWETNLRLANPAHYPQVAIYDYLGINIIMKSYFTETITQILTLFNLYWKYIQVLRNLLLKPNKYLNDDQPSVKKSTWGWSENQQLLHCVNLVNQSIHKTTGMYYVVLIISSNCFVCLIAHGANCTFGTWTCKIHENSGGFRFQLENWDVQLEIGRRPKKTGEFIFPLRGSHVWPLDRMWKLVPTILSRLARFSDFRSGN